MLDSTNNPNYYRLSVLTFSPGLGRRQRFPFSHLDAVEALLETCPFPV